MGSEGVKNKGLSREGLWLGVPGVFPTTGVILALRWVAKISVQSEVYLY